MRRIDFPEWREVLGQSEVPGRFRRSYEITICWYLSFTRRARADVTVQSARDFIECVTREKRAASWQVEEWKDALRWFFRTARDREKAQESHAAETQGQVWLSAGRAGWPEW